jgi:hypothetical protein
VANEANFLVRGHDVCDARQFIGDPPIVRIEESNQFAPALRNAVIKSRSLTAIGFVKNTDLGTEFGEDFGGAVPGAVVHHQNFPLGGGEILSQHALNRFFDEAFVVVGIDQYADERRGHLKSGIQSGSKHT